MPGYWKSADGKHIWFHQSEEDIFNMAEEHLQGNTSESEIAGWVLTSVAHLITDSGNSFDKIPGVFIEDGKAGFLIDVIDPDERYKVTITKVDS